MKKVLLAVVGLGILVAVVLAARRVQEERERVSQVRAMQARVYDARVAVDSCRNELAYRESLFRRFDTLVGELRGEVDAYEALDARGVPEEEYDAYLEAFEGYNDSVSVWEVRADSLRATQAVCRMLAEDHNALTDSFRARLEAEGMLGAEGGGSEPGAGPES